MLISEAIRVFVNGEPREVPPERNITGLLAFLLIAPDRVAVELNKTVVRKRDWASTVVREGAHVEVVEFVGGG